jgi:FkbM family methyltransferase
VPGANGDSPDAITSVFIRLTRIRWLHDLVGTLRVFPAAGFVLRRLPLTRRLKHGRLTYRITSLDQFSIAYEIFVHESYKPALASYPVETFIDLGCNAGWFALWLSAVQPNAGRLGLLVDANARIVPEAEWHLKRNGLERWAVRHGAVGLAPGVPQAKFHVYPSSAASSLLPFEPAHQLPVKGKAIEMSVPAISVGDEWHKLFGDAPVDLLKVDIEGKELDLFNYEATFIQQRVRRIILEWHKWTVSLAELDMQLASMGFNRRGVFDEDQLTGLALYERSDIDELAAAPDK